VDCYYINLESAAERRRRIEALFAAIEAGRAEYP